MSLRMVLGSLAAVLLMASCASAQIVVYSQPYVQPVPIGYGPMVVARPVVPAFVPPPPVAVVSAYRPVVPTYVAPVAAYSAYRPAYVAPVVVAPPAPVYGAVARYRTGVVGPGLGGFPSVYTPGQPVRNAVRYVVP